MKNKEITNEELENEEDVDEEECLDLESLGFDDESFIQDECFGEIAKTITVIAQPIKTTVDVGAREYANGKVKPFCKFSIERNITEDDDEFEIIAEDFAILIDKVKDTMSGFKEQWLKWEELDLH